MVKNLFYVIVVLVMMMSSCMDEPELGMDKDYPVIITDEVLMDGKHPVMSATVRLPAGIESLSDVGFYIYRNPPLSREDSDPFVISAKHTFTNKGFTLTLDDELLMKFHDIREYSLRYQAYLKKDGIIHIGELVDLPFNLPEGPVIESIRPVKGVKGDTVTIIGKGFFPSYKTEIFFRHNKAIIISSSLDSMKVIVPAGNGSTEVQVSINFSGIKYPSPYNFSYQYPVIESITPNETRGNEVITIKGNHFGHRDSQITLDGVDFTLLSLNNQEIKIQLNPNPLRTQEPVKITHDRLSGISQDSLFIINEWKKLKSFYYSSAEQDIFFKSTNSIYFGKAGTSFFQEHPRLFNYDIKMNDFVEYNNIPNNYLEYVQIFNVSESAYFVIPFYDPHQENTPAKFGLLKFDGNTESWINLPTTPIEFHEHGFLPFSAGDYGYMAGESALYKYSAITNTWQILDPLPMEALPFQATTFSINNKVYFGTGGEMGSPDRKAIYEMDVISNKITQLNDFPVEMDGAIGFSIGQKGYLGASYFNRNIYQYTPENDSWKLVTTFPNQSNGCMVVVVNSRAYVYCPWNYGEFYEFDPAYLEEQ
jgi:hypothetical protein